MGDENIAEFTAAAGGEPALRSFLEGARDHLKDITLDVVISSLDPLLPEIDRALLTDEFGEDMITSFREPVRVGPDGCSTTTSRSPNPGL
jgi:predicted ABC-class ATPase